MNELRLLGCAVLLNLGVAALVGAGIARHMIGTVPTVASVRLTEIVAEHVERDSRSVASAEETADATRAWARALDSAIVLVAERHNAVLLPKHGVAAGAVDLTAEVRAEMARALAHRSPSAERQPTGEGDSPVNAELRP